MTDVRTAFFETVSARRNANFYFIADPVKWQKIYDVVKSSSVKGLAKRLRAKPNTSLWNHLTALTASFSSYTTSTQIYAFLMGLTEMPKCLNCGNELKTAAKLFSGFQPYCCISCANRSAVRQAKVKATLLDRYGAESLQQIEQFRQKSKETCLKNLGVSTPFLSDDIKEKRRQTWLERYGTENPNQSAEIKAKKAQYFLDNYGVSCILSLPEVQAKRQQTCIERYGVPFTLQVPEIREQIKQTNLERYGVENAGASYQAHEKMKRKYLYDDHQFDSFPEVAYYIWLKDHDIQFEYQPKLPVLEYKDAAGMMHRYYPDFKVNGQLVEIKGSQLVQKDSDVWINEEKYRCAVANHVKILYESDYSQYLSYVESKYGKAFKKLIKRTEGTK